MRIRGASRALFVLAVLARAGSAHAQALTDANAAARRQLIAQAQQARDLGDHAGALELAVRAGRLQMSPSLRRFIAEEQSATGQLATALRSAVLCVDESQHDATPGRNSRPHAVACQDLIDSLRPRVGRVLLRVESAVPTDARIRVAGNDLPETLWGIAYDVDPGAVTIETHAEGRDFRGVVQVAVGAVEPVTIAFATDGTPALQSAHLVSPPAPASAPAQSNTLATTVSPAGTEDTLPAQDHSIGPYIVLGGGAVSFIGAGVFYAVRSGYESQWRSMCPTQDGMPVNCPDSGRPAYQNEVTWNAATNVALVVGGVALAGGAAWFLIDRFTGRPTSRATAFVTPMPGGVMLGIQGGL